MAEPEELERLRERLRVLVSTESFQGADPVTELCSPQFLEQPQQVQGTTIRHGSPWRPSYSMIGRHVLIQRPQTRGPGRPLRRLCRGLGPGVLGSPAALDSLDSPSNSAGSLDSASQPLAVVDTDSTPRLSDSVRQAPTQCSGDAEMFTPECFQQDDEDKLKTIYRFVCPHAGQFICSLTSVVFVMTGEGEVQYRIVSWDPRQLVGFDQMKPAGPLYSIDCFSGSVSGLHLPHCEIFSEENKESLAVAHFTGGNVEIMKPLQVNETHVIIDIRGLSLFGLLNWIRSTFFPTAAQVLLFLQPITARENKLYVHLLPLNVPLSEVKEQHRENTYIKTSSKCSLTSGSEYSLCCEPKEFTVQPETEMFKRIFDPNFHPTFEVFVNVDTEEVRLSLLNKTEGKQVWDPRRILLTGKDADPADHKKLTEREFVEKHREELIQRVSQVMLIADGLKAKGMISGEMYDKVHAAKPEHEQMRLLWKVLDSGGAVVKAEFYNMLKEKESHLVNDLKAGPSGSQ